MAPRFYPALHIEWPTPPAPDRVEQLLAFLDDETPSAVQEREAGIVVFFPTTERRDRAAEITRAFAPEARVSPVSVSDEAWAERSQAAITPIRIGKVIVTPPWAATPSGDDIVITIVPSMGFGTGHHASTRLCLRLLQRLDLRGQSVLDVGTGSGVLAIAAWRLGGARVLAIDVDPDALASARENVGLNQAGAAVELARIDLAAGALPGNERFDVVLANLTGAMLERFTAELTSLMASGGSIIVSGFQTDEEERLSTTFRAQRMALDGRAEEEQWIALHLRAPF